MLTTTTITNAAWRRRGRAILALPALLAACGLMGGCGGAGLSDLPPSKTIEIPESSAPPASVSVVDGWTAAPLGNVQVTPADPAPGTQTRVRAEGYLVRELRWPDAGELSLWPTAITPPDYIQELVYSVNPGRLARRGPAPLTITLEGELRGDPDAEAHVRHAAEEVARVTGLEVAVGDGGSVTIVLDPDDEEFAKNPNVVAYASSTMSGYTIASTRIVFASESTVRSTRFGDHVFLHEIAHGLGLDHSQDDSDVMAREANGSSPIYFSPREEQCLWMMYRRRRAGNQFPDRDYRADTSIASDGEPRVIVILD